jgi:hypothetical protein
MSKLDLGIEETLEELRECGGNLRIESGRVVIDFPARIPDYPDLIRRINEVRPHIQRAYEIVEKKCEGLRVDPWRLFSSWLQPWQIETLVLADEMLVFLRREAEAIHETQKNERAH